MRDGTFTSQARILWWIKGKAHSILPKLFHYLIYHIITINDPNVAACLHNVGNIGCFATRVLSSYAKNSFRSSHSRKHIIEDLIFLDTVVGRTPTSIGKWYFTVLCRRFSLSQILIWSSIHFSFILCDTLHQESHSMVAHSLAFILAHRRASLFPPLLAYCRFVKGLTCI